MSLFIIPISEMPEGNLIRGCGPCAEEGIQSNATHVDIEIDPDDPEGGSSITGLCPTHVLERE